jgi:hypothetical protein
MGLNIYEVLVWLSAPPTPHSTPHFEAGIGGTEYDTWKGNLFSSSHEVLRRKLEITNQILTGMSTQEEHRGSDNSL